MVRACLGVRDAAAQAAHQHPQPMRPPPMVVVVVVVVVPLLVLLGDCYC
jgi:hypothetical protein